MPHTFNKYSIVFLIFTEAVTFGPIISAALDNITVVLLVSAQNVYILHQ